MAGMRSVALSIARLALAVLAFVAITSTRARAEQEQGSCNEATAGWYCATSSSWETPKYCSPGQSGGCETCHYTGGDDKCFYSSGVKHVGYKTDTYAP